MKIGSKRLRFWQCVNKVEHVREITLPQFGIVQATNPSCLLYFP